MIIGLSGVIEDKNGNKRSAGSGKDTVADMFCEFDFCKIALADPMKRFCGEIFKFSHEQLYGASTFRNKPDPRYTKLSGDSLTVREALQTLGTGWGRECCPDIWADYCIEAAERLLSSHELAYHASTGVCWKYDPTPLGNIEMVEGFPKYLKGVIITDCRFKNEILKIKQNRLAKIIRIKRTVNEEFEKITPHQSEVELLDIPDSDFDFVIDNNGSLEDLKIKVYNIIKAIS